jgi:hypothetical protein
MRERALYRLTHGIDALALVVALLSPSPVFGAIKNAITRIEIENKAAEMVNWRVEHVVIPDAAIKDAPSKAAVPRVGCGRGESPFVRTEHKSRPNPIGIFRLVGQSLQWTDGNRNPGHESRGLSVIVEVGKNVWPVQAINVQNYVPTNATIDMRPLCGSKMIGGFSCGSSGSSGGGGSGFGFIHTSSNEYQLPQEHGYLDSTNDDKKQRKDAGRVVRQPVPETAIYVLGLILICSIGGGYLLAWWVSR